MNIFIFHWNHHINCVILWDSHKQYNRLCKFGRWAESVCCIWYRTLKCNVSICLNFHLVLATGSQSVLLCLFIWKKKEKENPSGDWIAWCLVTGDYEPVSTLNIIITIEHSKESSEFKWLKFEMQPFPPWIVQTFKI